MKNAPQTSIFDNDVLVDYSGIDLSIRRFHCLANYQRIIATTRDKAEITGNSWEFPRLKDFEYGWHPDYNRKGEQIGYKFIIKIEIEDVNGRIYETIFTEFYNLKREPRTDPQIGYYRQGLASRYHGTKSRNWTPECLTVGEIISKLNEGYAIAPGYFVPPAGESRRSAAYCLHREFTLFDGDVWTPEHPAPEDLDGLLRRYPHLCDDFYWLGESISSRSPMKPELRTRLMRVLPTPIYKGEDFLWDTFIDSTVEKSPFVARGVGIDKVRLSFGNARPESEDRVLGGTVSFDTFAEMREVANKKQAKAVAVAKHNERKKLERKKRRERDNALKKELNRRGYDYDTDSQDPIWEFCEVNPASLLLEWNLATHLEGDSWHWHDSGPGRSFELTPDGVIKPFTNTMQNASPESDPTKPVQAHRFILYYLYQLDITREDDQRQLRCILADLGYGKHPDIYEAEQHKMQQTAKEERLTGKRTPPVKLTLQPEYTPDSEDLETLRRVNNDDVRNWAKRTQNTQTQHMLILANGAGTGKSTAAVMNLEHSVDISPTCELADEKYEKTLEAGKNAFRHRSRLYNIEAAEGHTPETVPLGLDKEMGEVPCAYPEICNALAQKKYRPVPTFCRTRCPRFEECKTIGYLAQWNLMRDHDFVFLSYEDDFFSDPRYRSHIDNIMGDHKAVKVLVLDEVDPASLPPKRGYVTEHLKQLITDFSDFKAGDLLTELVRETAIATTPNQWATAMKKVFDMFPAAILDDIDMQLQGLPVSVRFQVPETPDLDLNGNPLYRTVAHITYHNETRTCAVLPKDTHATIFETLRSADLDGWVSENILPDDGWLPDKDYPKLLKVDTFCQIGFGAMDTPEGVNKLPPRLGEHFTRDLRDFLESVNSETPACHEERDVNAHIGWTYYLRPEMNARRGIVISASGVEHIIRKLYAHRGIDIQVSAEKPPEWKSDCLLFMVSTGRYTPTQSLIKCDSTQNYKAIELRAMGRECLNIIAREAETLEDKKILVVGPKDFTDKGDLTHIPEVAKIFTMPNVQAINHHLAEGVNKYEDCDIGFMFIYEPRPDEFQRIASRLIRDKTLSFEREKVKVVKDGVIVGGIMRYVDPDVQAIFDKECEKRLMQAITRLRPMIHAGKRFYLFTCEPISGLPVKPIPCTIDDMKACQAKYGTLDKLEVYLQEKAERSVQEVAEQDRVSERTARRHTKAQRDVERAELVQLVLDLDAKEWTEVRISKKLNMEIGSVQYILKKHRVT